MQSAHSSWIRTWYLPSKRMSVANWNSYFVYDRLRDQRQTRGYIWPFWLQGCSNCWFNILTEHSLIAQRNGVIHGHSHWRAHHHQITCFDTACWLLPKIMSKWISNQWPTISENWLIWKQQIRSIVQRLQCENCMV